MKTNQIIDILKKRYPGPRYVSLAELRLGTGYKTRIDKTVESRIDYWVLDTYPSSKHIRYSFECKISLQDFMIDIKKKTKQDGALSVSNQFFYIAPQGIIPLNLVPEWAGLIEIGKNNRWIVSKQAPFRETKDAKWLFVSSLGRRINAVEHLDIKNLSDEILHRMITAFYEGNKDKLSLDEFNYYLKLSNELIRRSNIKYNAQNSDSKSRQKFLWSLQNVYPYIPSEKVNKLWNLIKEKKIRIKKKRLEFVATILTNEEKAQYKSFENFYKYKKPTE